MQLWLDEQYRYVPSLETLLGMWEMRRAASGLVVAPTLMELVRIRGVDRHGTSTQPVMEAHKELMPVASAGQE